MNERLFFPPASISYFSHLSSKTIALCFCAWSAHLVELTFSAVWLRDDVSESASVFWKPLTLCFEARTPPPLLTFSVIIEAFHVCQPRPASTLVPDQPLVSGNLWVMSPGDCLIVPSHRFLSARLSPAEAGGISEPRRKTSRFLPRVCFLRHFFF